MLKPAVTAAIYPNKLFESEEEKFTYMHNGKK